MFVGTDSRRGSLVASAHGSAEGAESNATGAAVADGVGVGVDAMQEDIDVVAAHIPQVRVCVCVCG